MDGSIENNSKSDQDDSSLPDKKLFVWEMKRPALDPLPAPPFDLAQQRPEEEQAQPSTLDDCENEDRNKQKFWYIECLSREMGHVLESAESNVLPTGLDKEEFVSEHSVESNAVHQGSLNKWPPPTELNRCNTNLHDPALDGNCLFNSLIHFFETLDNGDDYEMTCSALREKAMDHLLDHRAHRTHSHTFEELLNWQLPDVIAHERSKRCKPSQEEKKLFGKMPKLSSVEDYVESIKDDTLYKCI